MKVNFNSFQNGHPALIHLVESWFKKSKDALQGGHDTIEVFMYLWISFNAWGMRVTSVDVDKDMVSDIGSNQRISESFKDLIKKDHHYRDCVLQFSQYWPIFSVSDVHKVGAYEKMHEWQDKAKIQLLHYPSSGKGRVRRSPERPFNANSMEWDDVIKAVYMVRCNLFHGNKGDAMHDAPIINAAFQCLYGLVEQAKIYSWSNVPIQKA